MWNHRQVSEESELLTQRSEAFVPAVPRPAYADRLGTTLPLDAWDDEDDDVADDEEDDEEEFFPDDEEEEADDFDEDEDEEDEEEEDEA